MNNRRPILLVDDDAELLELLTEHLHATGQFAVTTAASMEDADKAFAQEDPHFDAVVLDIGLPDGDGRD
jgi:DNA-binding response OmpR family regulator